MIHSTYTQAIASRQGKADYQLLQSWAESMFSRGSRAHSMIGAFVKLVQTGIIDLNTAKQNLIRISEQ